MDFTGLIVVVVGGSGGLGASICRYVASRGAKVALLYHVNQPAAAAVVNSICAQGLKGHAFQVDIGFLGAMSTKKLIST